MCILVWNVIYIRVITSPHWSKLYQIECTEYKRNSVQYELANQQSKYNAFFDFNDQYMNVVDGYIWVNMNKLWSLYFELGNQGHLTMKNEQQISVLVIQIKDSRYGLLRFRYHNKQTTHSRVCEITISFVHLQLNPVVMDCIVINENGILTIHMKWISIQQ